MALQINTSEYVKEKRVLVDGMDWKMKVPGAGDELAFSQAQRRVQRLEQKIESKTATDEDYDLYDKLENQMYERFQTIFSDGTEDNRHVRAWLDKTPMAVVTKALEDLKKQAEEKNSERPADAATEAAA